MSFPSSSHGRGSGGGTPDMLKGACGALVVVALISLLTASSPFAGSSSGSSASALRWPGGGGGGGGGDGSPGGGGYSQPISKRHVWFDVAALGGFKQLPLLTAPLALDASAAAPHELWIVVTTINPPTAAVKKLAELSAWRVVVIGDSKTPADWAWPNVVFLDLAAQAALGFSTASLLRTRSYCRKNLGYLYAISRGARVIYETDDDNALVGDALPMLATAARGAGSARVLEYAASNLTINHHVHFSQPSTWPRGYPLESIAEAPERRVREVTLTPAIQQGLANGDPDMDAIFRLTRKPADRRIDFAFAPAPPVALPMGSFGPFNAQNTLFTHEALWATVLPQTVEFRVCDIWRAYFVERLLWGVGAQLVFMPASVYQLRNSHSYLEDYISEKQIYEQVTPMLTFLRAWRCAAAAPTLPACAVALARDMATGGFWGPDDAELVRHFMHDLGRAGYAFPPWLERADSLAFVRACEAEPAGCAPAGPVVVEPLRMLPNIELIDAAALAAAA